MSSAFYIKKDSTHPMISALTTGVFRNCQKYLVLLVLTIIVIGILYYAKTDERAMSSMTYYYAFAVVVPTVIAFLYVQKIPPFGTDAKSAGPFYATLFLSILLYAGFYMYQNYANTPAIIAIELATNVIAFAVLVGALVIFYNMFTNYISNLQSMRFGIAISIIFYIPCLVSDFIRYLAGEYAITPTIVFLVFIIELILILLLIYIPVLAKKVLAPTGTLLLGTPVFLSVEQDIATGDELRTSIKEVVRDPKTDIFNLSGKTDNIFKHSLKNYSISFWIFVNELPGSNESYSKETTIFKYEHVDADGTIHPKPKLTYFKNTYYMYLTSYAPGAEDGARCAIGTNIAGLLPGQVQDFAIRQQRWNNFVVTYTDNAADIFVNGELVRTVSFVGQVSAETGEMVFPTYGISDIIRTGDVKGLYGAICNVQFFANPLSKPAVVGAYNYYNRLSPPMDAV